MPEPSGPTSAGTPLTQRHAQSLIKYADAITMSALRNWHVDVAKAQAQEVRDIAGRISRCVAESICDFTHDDLTLLTDIGDSLLTHAARTIAQPGIGEEAKRDAQFQLDLGGEMRAARDALRDLIARGDRRSFQ